MAETVKGQLLLANCLQEKNLSGTSHFKLLITFFYLSSKSIRNVTKCDISNLLDVVLAGALILKPLTSRASGSINGARKMKSLIAHHIGGAISTTTDAKEGGAAGKWIERGSIVKMSVTIGRGTNATSSVCRFRVFGVFDKYYNKWMLTEKKIWVKDMKVAEKKKFRIAVRIIEEENLMEDAMTLNSVVTVNTMTK